MPRRPPVHGATGKKSKRVWSPKEQRRRKEFDRQRGSASSRLYNYQWQKVRARELEEDPLCVDCLAEGKVVFATVRDHIQRHNGDPVLFWDPNNRQSLCERHHNRKTALEDSGFAGGSVPPPPGSKPPSAAV